MTNLKTFTAIFLKTSISDLTHCCTEPFKCVIAPGRLVYDLVQGGVIGYIDDFRVEGAVRTTRG